MSGPLSIRSRLADESGFSIAELLMAVVLITLAMIPLLTSFVSSRRANLASKRTVVATHEAQSQLEYLKLMYSTHYDTLAMTAVPQHGSGAVTDPNSKLLWPGILPTLFGETISYGNGGTVSTTPETVTRDGIKLVVYRYITSHGDACSSANGADPCGSASAKRITVAVVPAPDGGTADHVPSPVWVSTIKAAS